MGIALQAVGVAALGAIVYFAFLSPNDSGPLTGIDVDPPFEQQPPERQATKRHKPAPRPDRPRRRGARRASLPVVPASPPPPIDLVPDSPSDAQYSATVARVLDQVARAAP